MSDVARKNALGLVEGALMVIRSMEAQGEHVSRRDSLAWRLRDAADLLRHGERRRAFESIPADISDLVDSEFFTGAES